MDDVSHAGEGTQIDLAGYRSCRNQWCHELVLVEIAERTRGLCTSCFRTHLGEQLAEVEVVSHGSRVKVRVGGRRRAQDNKGDLATERRARGAQRRASRRLRMLFPDLWDVLYAEERARVGLNPWPIDTIVRSPPSLGAQQTMDFAHVYHQLTEHGVDVDGLEDPPSTPDEDARTRR